MCRRATVRVFAIGGLAIGCLVLLPALQAQSAPAGGIAWRHIGNSAMELALPSLATGAVDRVWYSPDGASLFAKTASGRVFETTDFEQWQIVAGLNATPPAEQEPAAVGTPEVSLKLASAGFEGRLY